MCAEENLIPGLNYVKLFTKIYIKVPYRYTHLMYIVKKEGEEYFITSSHCYIV